MSDQGFWIAVWLAIGGVLLWGFLAHPRRQVAYFRWMFGSTPRDYLRTALLLPVVFGGPIVAIAGLKLYPPLTLSLLWIAIGFFVLLWIAMFWIWKQRAFPDWTGRLGSIAARAGIALCVTALLLGVAILVNGYNTPVITRPARVVRMWSSRYRDPARRQYALYVQAWPGSDRVAQVDATQTVFNRVRAGDHVMLSLGEGRLGFEWVRGVTIP